jgi:tripartite ATP-independent transporter DctM subunit
VTLAAVFALLIALILLRFPIGFAMLVAGFAGTASITGAEPALKLVGQVVYATGFDYSWVVLPLFILMGNLISQAGFAADLYRASNSFLGHFRGGLAMATIVACGGLSAVSGSSLATAATMAKIAMPRMREYGYADRLAAASIAAGGTLGILIPPSIVMMIYGVLTETDIGKLFIAGILPGLIGVLGYVGVVYLVTLRDPRLGPRGERLAMRRRFASLRSVWPILTLFVFIIGGIYAGMFTPSEAAGMGVAGTLLLGVSTGRLKLAALPRVLIESGRTTAMLFFVVFGSLVLGNYANLAGVTGYLNAMIADYAISGLTLICLFVVVCFILGAIVESLSMILLTIPIFFPIFSSQGFDPIWFGIIVVVVTEISFIVPPLGLNLFVLKSTVQGLDTRELYRGIMPFMAIDFVRLALLIGIPGISLLLPQLMIR